MTRREPALGLHEVVGSTYEIRHEIARTDTGLVYEARDLHLDRPVAVKVAWGDPDNSPLMAEARRCSLVHDPCAVAIYGMGMYDGAEYVAAERVTGRMLHDFLQDGGLPIDLYLPKLRALIAAVAKA